MHPSQTSHPRRSNGPRSVGPRAIGRRAVIGVAVATALAAVAATAPITPSATLSSRTADAATTTSAYEPVGPVRAADTRGGDTAFTRIDESTIRVQVRDLDGVADDAVAAALTLTAVSASADGFVTAYPAGTARPETSNLNVRTGEVRANGALTRLGADGAIDVYTSVPAELLVDVSGVFVPTESSGPGRFEPSAPRRVLDTRGTPTPGAGDAVTLSTDVLGVPEDATAVAVNLTAVDSAAAGYFTLWPTGAEQPEASVLNVDGAAQTRAAFAIVPIGTDGAGISVFTSDGADLLVDVVGHFTGEGSSVTDVGLFVPQAPERIFDTRAGWKLTPRSITSIGGIAPDALALAANWTAVDANAASFLTIEPDVGPPRTGAAPDVSTVNGDVGIAVANLAITPIGEFGVGAYSFAGEHAIADVAGYFTGPGGTASLGVPPEPAPLPGSLPRPERTPRPPAAQLAGTPIRLEPALAIGNLTGMEWSVLHDAYYAITQDGFVHRVPADLSGSTVVLDLSSEVSPLQPFSERGLLGITFDPVDGRMFLHFTDRGDDSNIVSYALVDGIPDPASRRDVLFLEQPGPGHQGGGMEFDARGRLFLSFGDGGGSSGRDAQDGTNLHGSILRIVPNRTGDGYTVPTDNPFVGDPDRRDEIWVMGLRNPWQFSIDDATGDVWIADVGENEREEIDVVPAGVSGLNFGWYWFEGTRDRGFAGVPRDQYFVPPVFEYGRDRGVSVIGGRVYHGDAIAGLRGAYVFADMTGPLFAYGADGASGLPASGASPITGFVDTPERELLMLTLRNGIFRLLPG